VDLEAEQDSENDEEETFEGAEEQETSV